MPGQDPGKQSVWSTPSAHHKGLSMSFLCTHFVVWMYFEGVENGGNTHPLREGRANSAGVTPSHPASIPGGVTFTVFKDI